MKEKKKLRFWDSAFGTVLTFLILYIISNLLVSVLAGCVVDYVNIPPEWISLITLYFSVAMMGLAFFIYMGIKDKESFKTIFASYGNNNTKTALFGLLLGAGSNLLLGLVAGIGGSIKLTYAGMNVGFGIIAFIFVALQCIAEEIMDRVFLFQRLVRNNGVVAAFVISSVFFSAMHILNMIMYKVPLFFAIVGLVNIVLIGIFFSETVYFGNNVWFAFAFHTAWNFSQNFILGLPNSGNPATTSIFALAGETHDSILYSSDFGIEAGIPATILICVLIIVTYIWGSKKKKAEQQIAE